MSGLVLRSLAAVAALCVLAAHAACGPVVYLDQVTRRASAQVAAAKAANAERYAPYHYTLAVEYLHKAREEAAHADYQAANRFGRKSEQAARKAVAEAVANAADPSYEPPATPGGDRDAVPAKDGGLAPLTDDEGVAPLDDGDEGGQ